MKTSKELYAARLLAELKPAITRDGNAWIILFGENLHDGVAGHGSTPQEAALSFAEAWNTPATDPAKNAVELVTVGCDEFRANTAVANAEGTPGLDALLELYQATGRERVGIRTGSQGLRFVCNNPTAPGKTSTACLDVEGHFRVDLLPGKVNHERTAYVYVGEGLHITTLGKLLTAVGGTRGAYFTTWEDANVLSGASNAKAPQEPAAETIVSRVLPKVTVGMHTGTLGMTFAIFAATPGEYATLPKNVIVRVDLLEGTADHRLAVVHAPDGTTKYDTLLCVLEKLVDAFGKAHGAKWTPWEEGEQGIAAPEFDASNSYDPTESLDALRNADKGENGTSWHAFEIQAGDRVGVTFHTSTPTKVTAKDVRRPHSYSRSTPSSVCLKPGRKLTGMLVPVYHAALGDTPQYVACFYKDGLRHFCLWGTMRAALDAANRSEPEATRWSVTTHAH